MRAKFTYILVLSFILTVSVYSQTYAQRFWGIPFSANSINLNNAFNGGVEQARYQMADIDGDGDLDLFTYDRDTTLFFYRNIGNASNANFSMESKKFLNLPVNSWFYFVDINADNKFDLFTASNAQTMKYYRNTGTVNNPSYILELDPVTTVSDTAVFSETICTPVFADIDNDGDLDFLTGSSSGTVTFYRNIGTPQNFSFQFVTSFWAGLEILGGALLKPRINQVDDPRHGASSLYFSDVDADNDLDLFWGDYFGKSVYYIKNTGSANNFSFSVIDTNYPPPVTWQSFGYNMPRMYDIDNDGRKDFFVSCVIGSASYNNFGYYRNIGPNNNPQFTLQTRNYIRCVDVGANSVPAFTDIDNDNDQDLFIGSDHSTVTFYRNNGIPTMPNFAMVTDSLPIIDTSFYYHPTFGDLDNDGKKDMVLGEFYGRLRYFRNTGTLPNPVFTYQNNAQFNAMNVTQSAAPVLVDIDNDNDLDLFIGNSNGRIFYYRNTGSVSSFNFVLDTNFYQNIDVGNDSKPCFSDIDFDSDKDLIIGNLVGTIWFYRNTGSPVNPVYTLVTQNYSNINVSLNSSPVWVDIDTDTDKDLFVGNIKGGTFYYENLDVNAIEPISNEIPKSFGLSQNYPNPFNPVTSFKFQVASSSSVKIIVFDVLGRVISTLVNEQLRAGIYKIDWNASNYPSGVYYYQLITDSYSETRKMVLLK